MATHDKKKHPSASNLAFKLRGKIAPGCRYAVIEWSVGSGKKRSLVSCHRKRKVARETLAKVKALKAGPTKYLQGTPIEGWGGIKDYVARGVGKKGAKLMFGEKRYGVYDLISGKKVA
jgi:hypothetical protein